MVDSWGECMDLDTLKELISFDKFGGALKDMMLYFNIYNLAEITEEMAQEYLIYRRENKHDIENDNSNC